MRNLHFYDDFLPWRLVINTALAATALLYCCELTSGSEDPEGVMSQLARASATQYLQLGDNDLTFVEPVRRTAANVMVFQKSRQGVPILGANVVVRLDQEGNVVDVKDDATTQNLNFGPEIALVDKANAIAMVQNDYMGRLTATRSTAELVWFRVGDSANLAWQVETRIAKNPGKVSPTHLFTTLDAISGELLSQTQMDTNTYDLRPNATTGVFPRIVINDGVGAAGSQVFAADADFDPVVSLSFSGSSFCTGALIAPNAVVSARHCNIFIGDDVLFGTDSTSPVFTATVQSVTLPDGPGSLLDGGDVAILTLNSNVPGSIATPMRLVDQTNDLVGEVCTMIGFGSNGVGSIGHQNTSDGLRWGGQNIIDVYGAPASNSGSNIFSTDFDDGSAGANTIAGSNPTPLFFEATTAPGDSGGPILVNVGGEFLIAGTLSGGDTAFSTFGDLSWWTGTSDFRTEIEAVGGQFTDGATPPANDNWNSTLPVGALPATVIGTNVAATTEVGEQNLGITDATVWWFFTAPNDGMVTVDTFGSDFDTVLTIYDGFNDGATDVSELNFIAENDQAGGTNQSQVSFPVSAGICYEVRVGGFFGDMGNIVLNITEEIPDPPVNDDFANTILASAFPFAEMGDNFGATTEKGEQSLDITGATAWWFFNAPGDGTVTIDTFGSDFDTVLTIFDGFFPGATPADLNFIVENDQFGGDQSQVTFPVTDGACFEMRVGGFFGAMGNITLNGEFTPDMGVLLGDVNCDGTVNLLDVAPFVDAIMNGVFDPKADINEDGMVNLLDVNPFVALLTG